MAADLDTELLTALRQAKSKEMFFAFIPKGSEGKLIVSKKKIPPKEIAEAKKEIGGGNPVTGKCSGPFDNFIFQVAKEPSAAMGAAIKKVAKKETGLSISPAFQIKSDADAGDEDEPKTKPEAAKPAIVMPPESAGAPKPADGKPADDKPADAADLGAWQAARQHAINELKALAKKIAMTKHGTAVEVLKEINGIMTKLPANPKPQEIDKLKKFIGEDDTITAAEEAPDHFHKLEIRKPLLAALEELKV